MIYEQTVSFFFVLFFKADHGENIYQDFSELHHDSGL